MKWASNLEGELIKIALSGHQLLIYIALAAFVIGLIVVAIDFASAGLSDAGVGTFITMVVVAVVVVIIAEILARSGTISK